MSEDEEEVRWDVFISYASEDRAEVAAPLAALLGAFGLRVWYDKTELKLGESLRQTIDAGLAKSKHGVVILSKAFFAKHYPVRELNGLTQREVDGHSVILPIWHRVTAAEVRRFSPPLADRVAIGTSEGIPSVAWKILEAVHPEVMVQLRELGAKLRPLPELSTATAVIQVLEGALAYSVATEEVIDEAKAAPLEEFLQEIEDWDVVSEFEPSQRFRCEVRLSQALQQLHAGGWKVFGRQVRKNVAPLGKLAKDWPLAVVVVARSDASEVIEMFDGKYGVFRHAR